MSNVKMVFQCSVIFLMILVGSMVSAAEVTVFSDQQFVRTTGAPNVYTKTFVAEPGEAILTIRNGEPGESSNSNYRITSGVVTLNGKVLFSHDDFKHKTYILEIPITLLESNTLRVELESKPGDFISLEIIQMIQDPVYDLLASELQVDTSNCPDTVSINLKLVNIGEDVVPAGVTIALYDGSPEAEGRLLGTTTSNTDLSALDFETISFQWLNPTVAEATIYARVDDDGTGTGVYEEVDETNNLISLEVLLCQISSGESSVGGHIIDAVSGELLSGVQTLLQIDNNGVSGAVVASVESNSEGIFLFSNLAVGDYIVSAAHNGYIENQRSVSLGENVQLINQDIPLSPVLEENEIRIILTWKDRPADLEAHLTAPSENGCRYHCYYFNKSIPTASLDLDDRNGYGPETITITDKVSGTYRYYVHDFTNRYSNSRWLYSSGAEVKVFFGDREPMVFTVPNAYGNVWHVFDLDGDTGEITPVRTMSRQPEPGRIDYPTITSGASGSAYWNSPYTYQVRATDPDNDILTYSLTQAPDGMVINPDTGLVEWTPSGGQSGYYYVTITVDDGRCGEASQTYRIYVNSYPTVQFSVDPCSAYNPGGNITFTWSTTRATTVLIDQGIGEVAASGSLTIPSPDTPTVYTLTAFNDAALTKRTVPTNPWAYFSFSPRYISPGESTTLRWDPRCFTSASIDHGIGEVSTSGSLEISPEVTTTYYLTVANASRTQRYGATVYVTQPPPPPRPSVQFSIVPTCNLTPGEPLTLSWATNNATSVTISPDIGEVEEDGSMQIYPSEAGSYTLSATGPGGTTQRRIYFPNYPSLSFYSSAYGIDLGNPVTLRWYSSCADEVIMNQGIGELGPNGSLTVTPDVLPVTYTITTTNERGPVTRSVRLYQIAPRGTLTANPTIMKVGDSTTLSWISSRAYSCSISPDIGPVALNGSMTITPTKPTTYRLITQGFGGTHNSYASVGFVYPMADLKSSALTIDQGETVKLTWIYANAISCNINQGIGEVELGGERTVAPTNTTTYTMTATGPGGMVRDSLTINVIPSDQPPITTLAVNPSIVMRGDSTVLSWESSYTDSLTIEPDIGSVANTGSLTLSPEETTTYTATATGSGGTIITRSVVTVMQQQPSLTLSVDPASIIPGESTVLSWSSSNVDTITFDQGIGEVSPQGSLAVTPGATTLYTATATGQGGTVSKNIAVNVSYPAPVVNFTASPTAIQQGQSTTLSWSTENSESVTIRPGIGEVNVNGSIEVTPTEDKTYIISVVGIGEIVTSSVAVDVYPELQLQVDSPANTSTVTTSSITVGGQVSIGVNVTVNGIPATVSGTMFTAETVLGTPGPYTITVRATDDYGQEKTVEVAVTYTPELILEINEPSANAIFYTSLIQVSGQVTNNASVTVNGVVATVFGNTFTVSLPLGTEGPQSLLVVAQDSYGQQVTKSVSISYFNLPAGTIGSDKHRISSGESVTLTWTSENCESAVLEPEIGEVSCNDSMTVSPSETTEFFLRVAGLGKTVRTSTVVVVDDPYGDPTPEEQLHLEAINRARANPLAEAARLNIDLNEGPPSEIISPDSVPPLKFNILLARAARGHSQDMIDNNYFAHEGSDGSTPAERCATEGYSDGTGENLSAINSPEPLTLMSINPALAMHDDLFIDYDYPGRGHRINMLKDNYKDVGVGILLEGFDPSFEYGSVVTCNFGMGDAEVTASVLGVVYEDINEDLFYDSNEGIANVLIEAVYSGDKINTASAGGYSLPLANGEHTIQATLPDGRTFTQLVSMVGENVKLDFRFDMFSNPVITANLTSSVQVVRPGETARLIWESSNGKYAEIDNSIGFVPLNGSIAIFPSETTTYTIMVTGQEGTTTASFTVYVSDFLTPPTVDFEASPATINKGESATLTWMSQDAADVHIDNRIGSVLLTDSISVTPEHSTTYTITASSPGGVVNKRITVYVSGNPNLQPAGSFGAKYNNLIPIDATVDAYDPKRFSIITGQITDMTGNPLAGVSVTVLDHPKYGTVFTDSSGSYAIPVRGGATLTVLYDLADYLPVQRQVYVSVNDIGISKTVELLQKDPVATEVSFDGNPNTIIVHKSSVITDADGTRSISMVFQGDNRAYVVDENGNDIQEITNFTTRATEYQTPNSMPAELPKTSAFTYCTEMAVDGVERIRFENPVVTWVDNFLGFEVGAVVPVGYYDRDTGIWVASKNGIVVALLDGDSDGKVDSVDSNGDGIADDLNRNGNIYDEATGLSDPLTYSPGSLFWRVEVNHFTPWDYNWCSYTSLLNMFNFWLAYLDEQLCPDCPKTSSGSSVSDQSLIFYEDIAIPGTGLSLVYASDRTTGFDNVITVPASGTTVPSSVKRIVVEVDVAGQKLTKTLPALPEQVAEFVWDGLDSFGNPVFHKVKAHVRIGFVYDSYYMESGYLAMSFAAFGSSISSVPSREEVINWRRSELTINIADKVSTIAQGWSLSAHHKLNPTDPTTLHKGDGSAVKNITSVMATVAGNGEDDWPIDGANGLETPIGHPTSVAMDGEGNLYVANQVYSAVLKIDKNNIVEVIAGGMSGVNEADYIDAKNAKLRVPNDIAFDSKGNLYIADAGANKIRKIDTSGIITTVAGNGSEESSGDNGSAIEAGIMPTSLAVDNFGSIYIAEGSSCVGGEVDPVTGECTGGTIVDSSYRVRKVSTNGIISTIVGAGEKYDPNIHPNNGDGGPASAAYLSNPSSVSVDLEGNLYIADGLRIRKVNASGTISTVAGTGFSGYTGDGGLATDAQLTHASGVTFDKKGNFYFSQFYGNGDVIRKVDSNGYISTVAGKGEPGIDGDNGPATHALLKQPQRLVIDAYGFIYIPDNGNGLVRRVSIDSYNEGETHFMEANGVAHLISSDGYHMETYDLETGIPLLSFSYNDAKQLTDITDQFGNVVDIEYDGYGFPAAIISPDGLRTELSIDTQNQLTSVTYPDESLYTFEYQNNDGLLTAKIEPNSNRFEHYFDGNGRITHTNDSHGGLWQFDRDKSFDGLVSSTIATPNTLKSVERIRYSTGAEEKVVTNPDGSINKTINSADGLDTVNQSSCGMTVETFSDLDRAYGFTYTKSSTVSTPAGLTMESSISKNYVDVDFDGIMETVTRQVTTNSKTTTMVHDVVNSSNTITSPEERVVSMSYDPSTLRLLQSTVPDLYATDYNYLSDGKLQSVTTGNRITAYTYDTEGNLATITDPQERITFLTAYDEVGRLLSMEQSDGTILSYGYDNNGNMTLLTTPKQANNTFTYNGINKRSSFLTPLSSTTSYSYNEERQLTKVILPSTREIVNSYTNGRLVETTTNEWTNEYSYACGNMLDTVIRGAESIAYTYDGSLVTEISQTGSINATLTFTYNNDFNLTSFGYAGGIEAYMYDNDGLLTGSGNFSVTRNSANGLPEQIADDSLTLSRAFNGYGEVSTVGINLSGTDLFGYDLTRNDSGRITDKVETINGTSSHIVYSYDDLGRLLTVSRDSVLIEEYRYDNNGNRTYESNSGLGITGRSYTTSVEDHIVTAGDISFEFDYDDNLAARVDANGTAEYVYSSTGELMSVSLSDGTVISYINDPNGRRIAKLVDGAIVEKYLWAGLTTLLAIYDGSDNLLQRFEYADDRMPVAMTMGGGTYYLAYDQIGTLRLISDSYGNMVKRIDYDTFGNILNDSNPEFIVSLGFAGGLHDRDTGLVRFGYRDYMPEIGKWTAKDPILFAGGDSNLYGYVLNDPVNFVDPDGLSPTAAGAIAGGAVGGPPGAVAGAVIGTITGAVIGQAVWDNWFANEGDNDPVVYPENPENAPEKFLPKKGRKGKICQDDGSVWEKDHSSHGGDQWKRWPKVKDYEKGNSPQSIWPDGRIRK